MKIYSMTATFGKLQHETLTLKPGLNIIEAPNEWGKSTWCAFLVNMLYGIDTRARSTGSALADKERFAPWSGAPMSGRMEISWNGRDITIERTTRGRLIFGDFRAYETATGIDVPELNAANCGQMLLGVERSVFVRSGFVKLSDLPVTQDDALRRRLNSLVTTGDESGTGDKLGKHLKELKNKCRYNRTGLLPQAESQREQLLSQLNELQILGEQAETIVKRQEALEQSIAALENHKKHLQYEASLDKIQKVNTAEENLAHAKVKLAEQNEKVACLIPKEAAEKNLRIAQDLEEKQRSIQMHPPVLVSEAPQLSPVYSGMTPEEILAAAKADFDKNAALETARKKRSGLLTGIGIALLAVSVVLFLCTFWDLGIDRLWLIAAGAGAVAAGIGLVIWAITAASRFRKEQDILFDRHPGLSPDRWLSDSETQAEKVKQYTAALTDAQAAVASAARAQQELENEIAALTEGKPLALCVDQWTEAIAQWSALDAVRSDVRQKEEIVTALRSVVKTVEKPTGADSLAYTEAETETLLTSCRFEQKQLQLKLGQNQGRAEALGREEAIRSQLKAVNRRIEQLERTYDALELAQRALSAATTELQRRFAPRISKRAQALFAKLTQGRYQRITLGEDLSLSAATEDEDTLRPSQWRSDGTVDQLYLALRLAVAEELTPEAPLVLDDAFVRFDDKRLAAALDVLKESAQSKQVILFTCQSREKALSAQ